MSTQLKEIRCLNSLNEKYICGRWIGDMELYGHDKSFKCKRCGITWKIRQTENGTLYYKKSKVGGEKKEYIRDGVIIIEE